MTYGQFFLMGSYLTANNAIQKESCFSNFKRTDVIFINAQNRQKNST